MRVEPAGHNAMDLIFQGGSEEQSWRLENATVAEFLALLLRGKMRNGRQVLLPDAELTLEPPEQEGDRTSFRLAIGPLEVCSPTSKAEMKALKADIERSLEG